MVLRRLLALLRHLRTWSKVVGRGRFLQHGPGLHVGTGTRLWAPQRLRIGSETYIGKHVTIECNCEIGDFVLIANRVAIVGRRDHDHRAIGTPIRLAPCIGRTEDPRALQPAVIENDVWLGFGCIVLSGVRIGRGAIVGAGAVVARDVPPYAIVTGNPAQVVGERMSLAERAIHEASLSQGRFRSSELGPEHWLVEPKLPS